MGVGVIAADDATWLTGFLILCGLLLGLFLWMGR